MKFLLLRQLTLICWWQKRDVLGLLLPLLPLLPQLCFEAWETLFKNN